MAKQTIGVREQSVMVIKAKTDKAGLNTLAFQSAQIATYAIANNLEIIYCIIATNGIKEILREIKKLDERVIFHSIILYSPVQIAKDADEYNDFVETLDKEFDIAVRYCRSR